MTQELKALVAKKHTLDKIKRNVKALYLLSDLIEVYAYLDAKVEDGALFSDEADDLLEKVIAECANITVGQIDKLKEQF